MVFHRKRGFIVSVALLLLQFPHHAYRIIVQNTLSSVPGVFTNIFTIIAIVIIYSENHKIELYQKSMRDQAVTDSLTGLPNRFACTEFMRSLIRNDVKFTIVSIDLNNFKSINDTMGHETGNRVLLEIARRWRNLFESQEAGSNNLIGRFGGDDFALIIRDYASDREIIDIIQKYKTALEEKITIDNCDYFMTACFGYAEFPTDAKNISSLYSCADSAMHELKQKEHDEHILRFSSGLMKTEQHIEIDDFGTGYSSLSYLNKFPANLLKIDKSFIDEMNESASGEKYVAAIISMGHVLNLEVISEGVETTEQLDTLKKIGCDYIQGYVWGRPLPPEEAAKLIS